MKFHQRLNNGKSKQGIYRKRRFKCEDCDYTELIFADGARDLNDDVEAQFKHDHLFDAPDDDKSSKFCKCGAYLTDEIHLNKFNG